MNNKFFGVILIIVWIMAGAAISMAQSKNSVAIEAAVRRLLDAQSAYDVNELKAVTTADYIEISPLGEFDPREKMLGFYAPDKKPAGLEVRTELNEVSVRDYGKFGVLIAKIDYEINMGGKKSPSRSIRATFVVRNEKGVWKITSAHFTGIRPQAPPAQK